MKRATILTLIAVGACLTAPEDGSYKGHLMFVSLGEAALGDTAVLWLACPSGSAVDSAYHYVLNASVHVFDDSPSATAWELAEMQVEISDEGSGGASSLGTCNHPTMRSTHWFYRIGLARTVPTGIEFDWPAAPTGRAEEETDSASLSDLRVVATDSTDTEFVGTLLITGNPELLVRLCHSSAPFGCQGF